MAWAWEQKVGTTSKLVLLAFADHANPDGMCYPSGRHIADKTELHIDTVREHVNQMCAAGLLEKVSRLRRADGSQGPWIMRVCVNRVVDNPSGVEDPTGSPVGSRTLGEGGTEPSTSGVEDPRRNHHEPSRTVRAKPDYRNTSDARTKRGSISEVRDYDMPTPDADEIAQQWGIEHDHSGQIPDRIAERIRRRQLECAE